MKPKHLALVALLLVLAGMSTFFVQHLGPEPSITCVEEGKPTSGFSITKDGHDCALSSEDVQKIWKYDHDSALPLHRAGAALVLAGLGTGVAAGVKARKRRSAAAAPAGI